MTKDELIAAMDGLSGNTEVLLWIDDAKQSSDASVRLAIHYPSSLWVLPESERSFRDVKIPEGAVPAIVVMKGDER